MQTVGEPSDSPPDLQGEERLGTMIVDSALDDVLDALSSDDSEREEGSEEDDED